MNRMRLIDVDALWEELGIMYHQNNGKVNWNDALMEIKTAPTIEPEQKTGEWIDKGWNGEWQYQMDGRGRSWHEWQCSECNHITKGAKWNFCPNCGVRMVKEKK